MMPLPVGAIEDHMGGRAAAAVDRPPGSLDDVPSPIPPSADLWEV
jgi:hypothetical protein